MGSEFIQVVAGVLSRGEVQCVEYPRIGRVLPPVVIGSLGAVAALPRVKMPDRIPEDGNLIHIRAFARRRRGRVHAVVGSHGRDRAVLNDPFFYFLARDQFVDAFVHAREDTRIYQAVSQVPFGPGAVRVRLGKRGVSRPLQRDRRQAFRYRNILNRQVERLRQGHRRFDLPDQKLAMTVRQIDPIVRGFPPARLPRIIQIDAALFDLLHLRRRVHAHRDLFRIPPRLVREHQNATERLGAGSAGS